MRVILAANESIGYNCLKILLEENQEVIGIITDKVTGRLGLRNSRIICLAKQCGIKLYQPENFNDSSFVGEIGITNPDIIFNVAFLKIYKRPILEVPKLGCVNFHPGILPQYAGLHPWIWAIINGESEYGITFHYMAEKIDAGDIISFKKFAISDDDTGLSLLLKCYQEGEILFRKTLHDMLYGNVNPVRQDSAKRSYYPKKIPYDGIIDVHWSAEKIANFVRALTFTPLPNPLSAPILKYKDEQIIVAKAIVLSKISSGYAIPGQVINIGDDGMIMQTGTGSVLLNLSTGLKDPLSDIVAFCATKGIRQGSILGVDDSELALKQNS